MSDKWTLLMTGENYGLVGLHGDPWHKHPAHYERLNVVREDIAEARIRELEAEVERLETLPAISMCNLHPYNSFRSGELCPACRAEAVEAKLRAVEEYANALPNTAFLRYSAKISDDLKTILKREQL